VKKGGIKMAFLLITFDEPLGSKEVWDTYVEKRAEWWGKFLKDSGWIEGRALLDASLSSPIVHMLIEFENLEAIQKLLHSDFYREMVDEFRGMGGTNLRVKILKKSPVVPEPIHPGDI
jgi:hypothetical protein